jgi:hypothetical protein
MTMAQVFDSIESIRAFVGQPAVHGEPIVIDQPTIDAFAATTDPAGDPERRQTPQGDSA